MQEKALLMLQICQFVWQDGNERYSHSRAENVDFSARVMLAKSCITEIPTMAGIRLKGTITNMILPLHNRIYPPNNTVGVDQNLTLTVPSLWLTPRTLGGKHHLQLPHPQSILNSQSEQEKTPNPSILQTPGRKGDFCTGLRWAACCSSSHIPVVFGHLSPAALGHNEQGDGLKLQQGPVRLDKRTVFKQWG